jgi:hypothetical protein
VRFALREPDATLVLDLRDGRAQVLTNAPAGPAGLELACTAEDAYRWFIGKLDPASALRCGDLVSSTGPGPTLRTLAVLKHLRIEAWDVLPSWAR